MPATALVAAVLLGQSAFSLALAPQPEATDVAYAELAAGQPNDAVAKLEEALRAHPDDPATLINLGTAYARLGQSDRALRAYGEAIASRERYDLELADGSWVNSREAAREARDRLMLNAPVATRRP